MTRHINRNNLLQPKIPRQLRHNKRRHKPSTSSINMNRTIDILLDQQIINRLHILILPSVCSTNDSTNSNCVFVNKLDSLLGINHVAVLSAEDVALFNFKVASRLFPADLNGGIHDDVGLGVVFSGCFALVLPALFHGEGAEHLYSTQRVRLDMLGFSM